MSRVVPDDAVTFLVGEAETGRRLDLVLSLLSGISRSNARRWIDDGRVTLNRQRARPSHRVETGDSLVARPPEPLPAGVVPEAIPLQILYEDADVIVIDKAAGMVTHPAPGHASGTLVHALLHHCGDLAGIGGVLRPGIVHRLDRGTSGAMVAAKNDAAHQGLAVQFREHSIERLYLALVRGTPGADTGEIDREIGRHPQDRKRMSVRTRSGRAARTRWQVRTRYRSSDMSWLEVHPETGRTHQIRVHLASVGLPLVGDPVYGRGSKRDAPERSVGLERAALHAAVLGFDHPTRRERLRFEAPLPPDLQAALVALAEREAQG